MLTVFVFNAFVFMFLFVCSRLSNNGACNGDHMNFLLVDNKVYLDLDLHLHSLKAIAH